MPRLIVDADVVAYRAGFATEKTKYLVMTDGGSVFEDAKSAKAAAVDSGAYIWSRKELQPVEQATLITDLMIGDIRDHYSAQNSDLVIYLSGVGNFRHSVATRATYKGNRSGAPQPAHLRTIRDHLVARWGAVLSSGEEADDLIGIAATADAAAIICSIDKDLMQLPGTHYDFVKKEETTVSRKQAVLNFYSQVLSGDSTDNVPGLTGIGPAKAAKILAGAESPLECWTRCLANYAAEFGGSRGDEYATEAARLVYVRRQVNETWIPPGANKIETKTAEELGKPEASRKGRVSKRARGADSQGSDRAGDQV